MNTIKVVVFSSKLDNRPTIEVSERATKLELKVALDEAGIDYSGLSFADGMNQLELTRDSSVITSKAGKALLTLTPKRNKAGADLSFSQLRDIAKTDPNVKDAFIKKATELGKNWTQLKTAEMNKVYTQLQSVDEQVLVKTTKGLSLSPKMKALIKYYVDQILLEKEEAEFQAALDSVEDNFIDNDEDGDYNNEDEEYYD